jgi:high-affinity K+ transport system ATPase subunit B
VPVSFKKLDEEGASMFRRPISLVGLIYIIVGIVVAWNRGYITVGLLKAVLSALLAIFLWFLVLLGINMHVTG